MLEAVSNVLDRVGKPIVVGGIVSVHGTSYEGHDGVVMDVTSDHEPEDGPIAVFFDREVSIHFPFHANTWKGTPTPENYKNCPRVVCFEPSELTVLEQFSAKTMAYRLFGREWLYVYGWGFTFVPNLYSCQLKDCASGLKSTERTFVNFVGSIHEFHTCVRCHKRWNRMCTESMPELRAPIPGSPEAQTT